MKFINFDDIVSKNENNYINKNVFTPQHPCNCIIIGNSGCSKTDLLFNILFENDQDEIGFRLFKESNIIKLNNKNNNNYNTNQIEFNTLSLSSKLINYSNAYIEVEIELEIPFDETDQGKKSIPKLIALKNNYEIVKNLKFSFIM